MGVQYRPTARFKYGNPPGDVYIHRSARSRNMCDDGYFTGRAASITRIPGVITTIPVYPLGTHPSTSMIQETGVLLGYHLEVLSAIMIAVVAGS